MAKEVLEMEVKSNIKSVTKDTDEMAQSVKGAKEETKGLAKETENVGDASEKSVSGVKKLTVGFKTLATATGFIFLLNKAFEAFQEILGKNQRVVDDLDVAMESLSIAFNDLFGFIESNIGKITGFFKSIFEDPTQSVKDFGTAIKDNLIERFNSLLDTFGHLGKALGHLMEGEFGAAFDSVKDAGKESIDIWTGVDNSVDKLATTMTNAAGKIKDYATETFESAKATIELRKAAELAAVTNQGIIEQKDREAELQRQIRDDETKTFAERITANEKLKTILEDQEKLMLANAQAAVDYAQAQKDINASDENKIKLQEALNEQDAIKAQIAGFMSEQLTNQVSLEKELGEVQNEVLLAGLEGLALELTELERAYELKLEMARKAGADTAAITEQYEKERGDIIKGYQKEEVRSIEELSKNEIKWAEMTADEKMNIAAETAGNLSTVLGETTAAGKAAAIVQATIDTYAAAQSSFKAMAGIQVVGPVLGGIAAAAAIASGLKNVQAIASAGGGGGGGGSISAPATAETQPPAPQMMSGDFSIGGLEAPEPIKAFVVTDEMTSSQNQLADIRRRATI